MIEAEAWYGERPEPMRMRAVLIYVVAILVIAWLA
jgi:hypothetical protein